METKYCPLHLIHIHKNNKSEAVFNLSLCTVQLLKSTVLYFQPQKQ